MAYQINTKPMKKKTFQKTSKNLEAFLIDKRENGLFENCIAIADISSKKEKGQVNHFSVIIPKTNTETAKERVEKIKKGIKHKGLKLEEENEKEMFIFLHYIVKLKKFK